MDNTKTPFLLDESGFLSNENIEYRYDYLTLKYTRNLQNIKRFLEDRFDTQGFRNLEFKNKSKSQGEKNLECSTEKGHY